MALVLALAEKKDVCYKARGVLQVALAIIEALQRAKSARWEEAAATHKVLRQLLKEGGDDLNLMAALPLRSSLLLLLFALPLWGELYLHASSSLNTSLCVSLARKILQTTDTAEVEQVLLISTALLSPEGMYTHTFL
ncbi:Hypothetical protein NocV09_09000170 [Nannochloropsis oceanica]